MFRLPGRSLLLRGTRPPCVPPSRGRKSRTDPPAKSKVSRIKYPPPVCVRELLNVGMRYREYSAILTAIRAECKEGVLQSQYEEQVGSLAEQRHRLESEEHKALMVWNDEQNRAALRKREQRQRLEQEVLQRQRYLSVEQNMMAEQQLIREKEREIEMLQVRG
ncbi:hypothetical protein XENTR_v10000004 [Xenopus tropicalis]|nr:hypothetical protein XENTR_v10000004 [Xenopus tropicalis]KAE8628422.1 hypothetical protein XENTR_v10000004 [Xenopus tropicalis]